MQDQPSMGAKPETPIDIEEIARRLRDAEHLEPEVRERVAGLLKELAEALDQAEPSVHTEHLTRSTAELVQAVKDRHDPGLVESAIDRVEEAVVRAEAKAPVATGIVLRLIDVLAASGI